MKTITINVSEPVYRAFRQYARQHDRSTSELIREAMQGYAERTMRSKQTLRGLPPLALGKVLSPLGPNDDILGEMTHD
jgi:hypothetical protein